jgi:hypothetical protein
MLSLKFNRQAKLHLLFLATSLVIGAFMAFHLGQDLNWDLLNYHFYDGYSLVHHRLGYDIEPAQLQTYDNPLIEVPGYLLITHLSPLRASMIIGAFQGLNIWLVFEIALVLLKRTVTKYWLRFSVSAFIGILSFFGAVTLSETGNTMGDSLTSVLILASLLLVLISIQNTKFRYSPRTIRLAAYLIAGFAVGLKLTNLIYALALVLAGLAIEGSYKYRLRQAFWHTIFLIAGLLVTSGYWYLRMWQLFKNPIFPFYNHLFHSTFYPTVNFVDGRWFPKTLSGKLFYPFTFAHLQSKAADVPFRDPRLAVLYVALVILVIVWTTNKLVIKKPKLLGLWQREHVVFWIFFLSSYILWEKEFSYYRYLMPIEVLSLVAIAMVVYKVIKNVPMATTGLLIIIVVITHLTVPLDWGRIPWQKSYFGPDLNQQLSIANGTVLMGGGNPESFLVPFLPISSRVIRVSSNMTSPNTGTYAEQLLIRKAITKSSNEHQNFYAIETTNEQSYELATFKPFGYKNSSCETLNTYPGEYLFYKTIQFELCKLENISTNKTS